MEILFLMLLTAHLLSDFVLDPYKTVKEGERYERSLIKHSVIAVVATFIVTVSVNPFIYVLVFVSHLFIDKRKLSNSGYSIKALIINQAFHVLAILFIAALFANTALSFAAGLIPLYRSILIAAIGLILCVSTGAVLIEKITSPFAKELDQDTSGGLTNGGKLIGQLERAMVYALVLFGHPGAIGFLFAAKSILRFGEIKEPAQRKQAEYIIIGTFASFGWAIFISFSTAAIIGG